MKLVREEYEVQQNVLTLMLTTESLLQLNLPKDIKKEGYVFLKRLEEMTGIADKRYDGCDKSDWKYKVEIEYEVDE